MMTLKNNNNNVIIITIKVLPSSTPVSPISQPIIEILTRDFQDAFRFPKNTLSIIMTLNIIIIIIIIFIIKVLPSSTPVSLISQPIIQILTPNFQDAFRFPKNTLSFILTLTVNFIIVFINIIKVLPSSTPVSPISRPIIEILPRNFQDKSRFPKNALFFILTLIINIIIIIIIIIVVVFIIIIKVLPSSTPLFPISQPLLEILT